MSRNTKTSSASAASLAARTLNNGSSSGLERSLAGSVLAQRGTASQTGARMEERAGRALNNERSSATTRTLAASLVSQSNKAR